MGFALGYGDLSFYTQIEDALYLAQINNLLSARLDAHFGGLLTALVRCVSAAGVKAAALGWFGGVGGVAVEGDRLSFVFGVWIIDGQQRK